MSLYTKFGYDMSKAAEKMAYFLFGGVAVEFDWLSRPNSFELENSFKYFLCDLV